MQTKMLNYKQKKNSKFEIKITNYTNQFVYNS